MISRRNFVARAAQGLGLSMVLPSLQACHKPSVIPGQIMGPNAALGHRLRTMDFGAPADSVRTDIVVVGGGVAGLSAARYLKKHTDNFMLLELEENTGGNAMGGSNKVSAFPWGAHYLPLPGTNDPELTEFLTEAEVITDIANGLPVFNEYYLCHDPKERLYIQHHWQEGIVPHEGVPQKDREEIERFLAMMHGYKELKGDDGREAFAIPVTFSSTDEKILALDAITAEQYLADNNFTSPYLRWYVNYCCADDYGTSVAQTSAWAMVHYFASRKGKALNAASDSVLTWPEGNYWLIKQLRKNLQTNIQAQSLAYNVSLKGNGVEVLYFDAARNISRKIEADAVIMATPQFINQRLLAGMQRNLDYRMFEYAPWMVANITTNLPLNERRGEQLCWDNGSFGSDGLGYVNASHQQVNLYQPEKVITYYKPLLGSDPRAARQQAYSNTFDDWKAAILAELQKPHPGMEKNIQEMNVWLWGHGMIKPSPGFIWSSNRKNAAAPLNDRIHFAHADLSGISIFEEAFYNGHQSARAVLNHDA